MLSKTQLTPRVNLPAAIAVGRPRCPSWIPGRRVLYSARRADPGDRRRGHDRRQAGGAARARRVARGRAGSAPARSPTSSSPSSGSTPGSRSRRSSPTWREPGVAERARRRSGPTSSSTSRPSSPARRRPIFEKGYRVNLDGTRCLLDAIRAIGRATARGVVFASSIAVFGAPFPEVIGDDSLHDAADELRDAEGDRRAAAVRLHPARLPRRRRRSACRRSASGRARRTGPRRGSSRASSASR